MSDEAPGEVPSVMGPGRLEAFSDGVIAVIITIMAFELKTPAAANLHALAHELPLLLVYALASPSWPSIGSITITCCA